MDVPTLGVLSPATSPQHGYYLRSSARLAAHGFRVPEPYGVHRVWVTTNRTGNFEAAGGRLSDCARGNFSAVSA
jgi:hypothetical protein